MAHATKIVARSSPTPGEHPLAAAIRRGAEQPISYRTDVPFPGSAPDLSPADPDTEPGTIWVPGEESWMPGPKLPEFRRRAVELARLREMNRPGFRAGSEATRGAWGHVSTEEVSGRAA